MTRTRFIALAVLIMAAVLVAWLASTRRGDVSEMRRLPDGSTFQLLEVTFTATNHTLHYRGTSKFVRLLAPILPPFIQNRFSGPSATLGGSDFQGVTNLIALTVNRSQTKIWRQTRPGWLRVVDEFGNAHDGMIGGSMVGQGLAVNRWGTSGFPHRGRTLTLQFFGYIPGRGWTNLADFRIPNPFYAAYPQWKAEPWPNTKTDETLRVTLEEFKTWTDMTATNMAHAARMRLVFSFTENGKLSEDWRIQKLTVSDVTGNRWSPYLDFVRQDFNWATNGTLEVFGALPRGEEAWMLNVEVLRTAGFDRDDSWDVQVVLPAPRIVNTLTNTWQREGLAVTLVSVASPETDHAGDSKWIAKWWGEDKSEVYSLALNIEPNPGAKRLSVIGCIDERGREVKIVQHGSQDFNKQAVFFTPPDGATEVRFTFAVQHSRFVEFLARPEFVNAQRARERGDSTKTSP